MDGPRSWCATRTVHLRSCSAWSSTEAASRASGRSQTLTNSTAYAASPTDRTQESAPLDAPVPSDGPVTWSADELERIGAAEELQLASRRPDGSLRPFVTIWVVRAGDDVYVRS